MDFELLLQEENPILVNHIYEILEYHFRLDRIKFISKCYWENYHVSNSHQKANLLNFIGLIEGKIREEPYPKSELLLYKFIKETIRNLHKEGEIEMWFEQILSLCCRSSYNVLNYLKKYYRDQESIPFVERLFAVDDITGYTPFYDLLKFGDPTTIYNYLKEYNSPITFSFVRCALLNPKIKVMKIIKSFIMRNGFNDEGIEYENYATYTYLCEKKQKHLVKKLIIIKDVLTMEEFELLIKFIVKTLYIHTEELLTCFLDKLVHAFDSSIVSDHIMFYLLDMGSIETLELCKSRIVSYFEKRENSHPRVDITNYSLPEIIYLVNLMLENNFRKMLNEFVSMCLLNFSYKEQKCILLNWLAKKKYTVTYGNRISSTVEYFAMTTSIKIRGSNDMQQLKVYRHKNVFRKLVRCFYKKMQNRHFKKMISISTELLLKPSVESLYLPNSFIGNEYKKLTEYSTYYCMPKTMNLYDIAMLYGQDIFLTPKVDGITEDITYMATNLFPSIKINQLLAEKVADKYYIFDVIGPDLHMNIFERLSLLKKSMTFVKNIDIKDVSPPTVMNEKILEILSCKPITDYPNDGWIIYYLSNTYKLKFGDDLTIDLLFTGAEFVTRENEAISNCVSVNNKEAGVYRLKYNPTSKSWETISLRSEKKKGNPSLIVNQIIMNRIKDWRPRDVFKYSPYYEIDSYNYNLIKYKQGQMTKLYELLTTYSNPVWYDLGCGYGTIWKTINCEKVIGIDIDPFACSRFQEVICNFPHYKSYCIDLNNREEVDLIPCNETNKANIIMNYSIQYAEESWFKFINRLKKNIMVIRFNNSNLLKDKKIAKVLPNNKVEYYLPWKKNIHVENICTEEIILNNLLKYIDAPFKVILNEINSHPGGRGENDLNSLEHILVIQF